MQFELPYRRYAAKFDLTFNEKSLSEQAALALTQRAPENNGPAMTTAIRY